MNIAVRSLKTAVPKMVLVQDEVRDVFLAQPGLGRLARRIISTSFNESGIDTRHTVIEELTTDSQNDHPMFFDADSKQLQLPSTKERNELYISAANQLYVEIAREIIDDAQGIEPSDITHVITVSCTGFYAPGPDYVVARELALPPDVQRYHFGFMGCYAAMPALRAASQFCIADPHAVVLVVSVELCTLHLRSSQDPDSIVACSLFSDGAAGAIVSSSPPEDGEKALIVNRFETVVTPVGEEAMAWTIGDHGFEMVLSAYVPKIIDEHIEGALGTLLEDDDALNLSLSMGSVSSEIKHWAIHPGGRSILDRVEERLGLTEEQLTPAREVLRRCGNMSSATILFVLKSILEAEPTRADDRVAAMAFGPGLTVETGLFTVATG